jgi:3-hydroxyacyl-[acyl-carrier-protein] dehydratase
MLSDTFYKITQLDAVAPQHYRALVLLIPDHPVYEGHFPDHPVVPGVCSLQMIVECAGKALGVPVMMVQASFVKFLGIVQPSSDQRLEIDLQTDDAMSLKASVKSGERTVLSCKLKLERKNF